MTNNINIKLYNIKPTFKGTSLTKAKQISLSPSYDFFTPSEGITHISKDSILNKFSKLGLLLAFFKKEKIEEHNQIKAQQTTTEENLEYIPQRGDEQFSAEEIKILKSLPEKQYQKAKKLLFIKERKNQQLEFKEIINLSYISDENFEEAEKFLHLNNRTEPFKGDTIMRFLELPKEQKERIFKRKLLNDHKINDNKNYLTFNEIKFLSKFDDEAWVKIKERNLIPTMLEYQPQVISNRLWQKIIKLPDNELTKTLNLINSNKEDIKFLNSTIIEKKDGITFDEEGLHWARKFAPFTANNSVIPLYSNDLYTRGLRDKDGNIQKNTAEKLYIFLKHLQADGYNYFDIIDIFEAQLKHSSNLFFNNTLTNETPLFNQKDNAFNLEDINAKINMHKTLINKQFPKNSVFISILKKTQSNTQDFIHKLLELNIPNEDKFSIINLPENNLLFLSNKNIPELLTNANNQCNNIQKNPNQYVSENTRAQNMQNARIKAFIHVYKKNLILASAIFDKETLNAILRLHVDNAQKYLDDITQFKPEELEILSKLTKSKNIYNKPFLPAQKIQFIDLIKAYKENNMDFSKMENMIREERVNIPDLNIDLLKNLLKKTNLPENEINDIPSEKLLKWDINNIHLLAKEITHNNKETLDLLKISNISNNFLNHITQNNNEYSAENYKTKSQFMAHQLDYNKWIKPPKHLEVQYTKTDAATHQFLLSKERVCKQMNQLIQSPAGKYIKKQLPKFINNDEFNIPEEYTEKNLTELLEILTDTSEKGQLYRLWQRAQENIKSQNHQLSAVKTIKILNSLNQDKKILYLLQQKMNEKNLDITIKMWDRNPQKDIFQGNYSTCCIGMGHQNGSAMPIYLLNTTFNMIEIVNNKTKETIGNALCFFATNTQNNPCFVIDNIEINNSQKDLLTTENNLRDAIFDYAKKIAQEISGNKNCEVYLGTQNNDVKINDLRYTDQKIKPIGEINAANTYLDIFNGWLKNGSTERFCPLYMPD